MQIDNNNNNNTEYYISITSYKNNIKNSYNIQSYRFQFDFIFIRSHRLRVSICTRSEIKTKLFNSKSSSVGELPLLFHRHADESKENYFHWEIVWGGAVSSNNNTENVIGREQLDATKLNSRTAWSLFIDD